MNLVNTKEEIISNLLEFNNYRTGDKLYFTERIKLGKQFVVELKGTTWLFCPSRFAGYRDNTKEKHEASLIKDGTETTPKISKILSQKPQQDNNAEQAYIALCQNLNIKPSRKERTYWVINLSDNVLPSVLTQNGSNYPDEVNYIEGATKQVHVNIYERNPEARKSCLKHYGFNCAVCGFNFKAKYGSIGEEFIHVHHLVPISSCKQEYKVNPIEDLRPVCPNCHSMLHKSDPPFSIEELRELIDP